MNTEFDGNLDAVVQEALDNDQDFQDSLVDLTEDEVSEATKEKRTEVYRNEVKKLQDSNEKSNQKFLDQKERAEIAERGNKKPKEGDDPVDPPKKDELSQEDIFVLVSAGVHKDDLKEVQKASKLLDLSIEDSLKDPMVIAILEKNTKHRESAKATNTKNLKRGNKSQTGADVQEATNKGDIPKAGTSEAEALYRHRRGLDT